MFFIMGIYDKSKEVAYNGGIEICSECGRYCSYKVFVTYTCLSLFFIPVFKWNKQYFVKTSCCGKTYELTKEQGKQAEKGERIKIEVNKEL